MRNPAAVWHRGRVIPLAATLAAACLPAGVAVALGIAAVRARRRYSRAFAERGWLLERELQTAPPLPLVPSVRASPGNCTAS